MRLDQIYFNENNKDTEYFFIQSFIKNNTIVKQGDPIYKIKSVNISTNQVLIFNLIAPYDCTIIKDNCILNGEELESGMILCDVVICSHSIISNGVCTECNIEIISNNFQKIVLGGSSKTLFISIDEFNRWRESHNARLLKHKKLVLILDLDNTILETFCCNKKPRELDFSQINLKNYSFNTTNIYSKSSSNKNKYLPFNDLLSSSIHSSYLNRNLFIYKTKNGEIYLKPHEILSFSEREDLLEELMSTNQVYKFKINGTEGRYFLKPRPGYKSLISSLHSKYELYVYTMGKRDYAKKALEIMGITKFIREERIVCAEDSEDISYKELKRISQCDERFVIVLDDRCDIWGESLSCLRRVKNFSYWKEIFMTYKMICENGEANKKEILMKKLFDFDNQERNNMKEIENSLLEIHEEFYNNEEDSDVRKIMHKEKSKVLLGKKISFLGIESFKIQSEEAELYGATTGELGEVFDYNSSDYILVIRIDLILRPLIRSDIDIKEIIDDIEKRGNLKFVSYEFIEDQIGICKELDHSKYLIDDITIIEILKKAIEGRNENIKRIKNDREIKKLEDEKFGLDFEKEIEENFLQTNN